MSGQNSNSPCRSPCLGATRPACVVGVLAKEAHPDFTLDRAPSRQVPTTPSTTPRWHIMRGCCRFVLAGLGQTHGGTGTLARMRMLSRVVVRWSVMHLPVTGGGLAPTLSHPAGSCRDAHALSPEDRFPVSGCCKLSTGMASGASMEAIGRNEGRRGR